MTNDQLDRLSKLVQMTETCAKLGGTPMFSRVTALISDDFKTCLDEIESEKDTSLTNMKGKR